MQYDKILITGGEKKQFMMRDFMKSLQDLSKTSGNFDKFQKLFRPWTNFPDFHESLSFP